jgi:iron-sulfur cluster repair protein YtfE (RIC family)
MGAAGLRERAKEFVEFYQANLAAHFRAEEEALFPTLRRVLPESSGMLDDLVREHEHFRQAVSRLDAGTGLAKLIFDLGDLLERHIRREERDLFPLFQAHIDPVQAELIGAQIKNILAEGATKRINNLG